ncbi:odorant receptor 85b-like [Aricia agestis]|uniref:odorant receptor 85b-like n=1 Tax=Aricia agestis TaxID=91739 RepID=UPI001C209899|nr:odorant receptor 85b-like [Aricia agestis]
MPLLVTIYSINTSDTAQYEFPVQVYFFCWLTSHYQYALAYSYFAFTCTAIHMCIYISCDFVLVALTFDVSALLTLLQNDLRNIVHNKDRDESCDDIRSIVVTHQKLLRLTKRLDDIFGAVIFTQVSFSSVVICCFGFLSVIDNGLPVARNLTAALGIMFAIFILAYPGQLLADTSSGVASAAYECLWYNRSVKFQKYIAIILARAQKPCFLTAMGFAELTLAMFSRVLSTSWSYLSLLNQMYQDMELD